MPHERPPKVRKAMLEGNLEALKAFGRAGAKAMHREKDVKQAINESLRERTMEELSADQAKLYSVSEEGDVLPPQQH